MPFGNIALNIIIEICQHSKLRFILNSPHSLHRDEESDTKCIFCESLLYFVFFLNFEHFVTLSNILWGLWFSHYCFYTISCIFGSIR